MDTESQQADSTLCSDWGCWPDDILILTCNHNLCLMCASKNLQNESRKSQYTFQTVVCNTCGLATVLDPESATTLISIYNDTNSQNNSPMKMEKGYNPLDSPNTHMSNTYRDPKVESQPYSIPPPQPHHQKQPVYCQEHPDELVNYFCFQCNIGNICAEWVIHGSHHGHDVQTIKKGICTRLEDLKANVSEKIEELLAAHKKIDMGK